MPLKKHENPFLHCTTYLPAGCAFRNSGGNGRSEGRKGDETNIQQGTKMKPKLVKQPKHDYKEQLARRNKGLQGQATYAREKQTPVTPTNNARELFKPGRDGGDVSGALFPVGKMPKGNAPEWVKDFEKYGFMK